MLKAKKTKIAKQKGGMGESVSILIQALILAFVIRTFLFQPYSIPSGSMRPTLLVGDYLFVSKYAYGYSRFSLPFSPNIFSGRIWPGEPQRGDVVVFRHPRRDDVDFIKRVVGLPGDEVQMRDGQIFINDVPVAREKIGETRDVDMIGEGYNPRRDPPVSIWRETMDNGASYNTFDIYDGGAGDNTAIYHVPQGSYFMMGDNRDNSDDSRFSVGMVPNERLIGRANILFFSIGNNASAWQIWRWPFDTRWGRMFSFVQTIKDVPAGDGN